MLTRVNRKTILVILDKHGVVSRRLAFYSATNLVRNLNLRVYATSTIISILTPCKVTLRLLYLLSLGRKCH